MAKQTTAAATPPPSVSERLRKLFDLLGIGVVYHVDDANNLGDIDVEIVIGELQKIFGMGKDAELADVDLENWDRALPPVGIIESLRTLWVDMPIDQKKTVYAAIRKIASSEDQAADFERTTSIAKHFPDGMIKFLSPHQWEDTRGDLETFLVGGKRALVLFDEDLSLAGGAYAAVRGQDLIVQVLDSNIKEKVISTLLTQKINVVNDELGFRDQVITDRGEANDLSVNDFFPLAKNRLDDPELFGDGIKKVLLNRHLEGIKAHTTSIIEYSYIKAIEAIKKFDTYDFDDTILKTSVKDGIWEPHTIMRIADIVFEDQLKKRMVQTGYVLKVNPELKAIQDFAEIVFTPSDVPPYSDKLVLRHQEIYESGGLINPLRKPLENGDIFQMGDHNFTLVAQACDMAVRKKAGTMGLRTAKMATLLKINILNDKEYSKKIKEGNYLSDKYPLPYFNEGTKDFGVVDFKDFIIVDIDYLDLCVFNASGECSINLNRLENRDYFSKIWDSRYSLIIEKMRNVQGNIRSVRHYLDWQNRNLFSRAISRAVPKRFHGRFLRKNERGEAAEIEKAMYPKFILASANPVEHAFKLEADSNFNFAVKRTGKYKDLGATYLLERYTRYLARVAEPHDFAN